MNKNISNSDDRGAVIYEQLLVALNKVKQLETSKEYENYLAYLHGQIWAFVFTLQKLFPGVGNWGDKAGKAVKPVLTEDKCDCHHD
ncbi:hypothetical protein [Desulfolucanica intricata]|uniref:hypothetical protein n=1 Tax=Desulfolucanica intricata TaxID=1285191 RepID=UPI0008358B10|nr:hypothetical protein [Desulfolucanica intricata]